MTTNASGGTRPPTTAAVRADGVHQANLAAILWGLHVHGALTRSELVARTGLTRSTIGALVGELVGAGLAVEAPAVPDGRPGRPSPVVRPDASNEVLALEVAVDYIAGAVVGLGGTIHALRRIDRNDQRLAPAVTVADLAGLVDELVRSLRRPVRPVAVGVAIAGLVRGSDRTVAFAPNLGWRDVPIARLLGDALSIRAPISIANESDLATLAESLRGAAHGVADVLLVSGEVGVGGGLVSDGRSVVGASGFAGEIGHLTINPVGQRCRCGSVGCWETEVGEGSLLRRAGKPATGGRAAVDTVLAEAADGDKDAVSALREEARWIAIGLGGLLNVLNPRLVVFGGFFGRVFPFIIDGVRDELREWTLPETADVDIVPAALGLDSSLIGAAELAFGALLADPLGALRSPRRRS